MRYLINKSTNPYFNLAFDEYAFKHINIDEDFFYLWRNEPSVIVGKNQNTFEEINQAFIDNHNIKVARRVSGGGTVYHDLGNLNFTFIINVDNPGEVNYKKFVQPVIDALKKLGVQAETSSRNDILINGFKISGNAQRMANKKLMYHGTLLYDVKLEDLRQALHVNPNKYNSIAVKSVRSNVTNIKEHLHESANISDFYNSLHFFLSNKGLDKEIVLNEAELSMIEFEAINRFATWDWIYGESPLFSVVNKKSVKSGILEIKADVEHGHIQTISFIKDYTGLKDVSDIEERLKNIRFVRSDIDHILNDYDLHEYFGEITKDELLSLMFD
ncbi:MAG: lipoate--protein ligase [Erysipelothrix sp.]|jgi:lipoate-protein ligase A|nr:lipoate--protein ligase [Erysipelothrix sp.]